MPAPDRNPYTFEIFGYLSRRARLQFFLAVFFTFVPIALLFDLVRSHRVPVWEVALWGAFSGLVAVGWRTTRFLYLVIPLSFVLPAFLGQRFWGLERVSLFLILELAACIVVMALGYAFFVHFISIEGVTSLRLRTEIGLAEQIHAELVPPVALVRPRLEVYGASLPTSEVGGDLLDYLEGDGRLGVYLADVSGHGVSAGVLMAMIKSAIRTRSLDGHRFTGLMHDLNTVLVQVTRPTTFATFAALQFAAEEPVDPDGGDARPVEYALAGHLPILHWQSKTGTLRAIDNLHPPLGILPGHVFAEGRLQGAPGDLWVLYTDGLTETMDASGAEFGEERLRDLIVANATRPLADIHATLLDAVRAFGLQLDDRTLVFVRQR